jgi:hypothetical protein
MPRVFYGCGGKIAKARPSAKSAMDDALLVVSLFNLQWSCFMFRGFILEYI